MEGVKNWNIGVTLLMSAPWKNSITEHNQTGADMHTFIKTDILHFPLVTNSRLSILISSFFSKDLFAKVTHFS